jgi:hypothetical protein
VPQTGNEKLFRKVEELEWIYPFHQPPVLNRRLETTEDYLCTRLFPAQISITSDHLHFIKAILNDGGNNLEILIYV